MASLCPQGFKALANHSARLLDVISYSSTSDNIGCSKSVGVAGVLARPMKHDACRVALLSRWCLPEFSRQP